MYGAVEAQAHAKLMVFLETATPAEICAISIRAGIHNQDGTLTRHYMPEDAWFRQEARRWYRRHPNA